MKGKLKKILCFIIVFVMVLLIASIPFYKFRKYGDQFLNNRWKIEQVQNERQDTFDGMFWETVLCAWGIPHCICLKSLVFQVTTVERRSSG